jgi:hypothetical protein
MDEVCTELSKVSTSVFGSEHKRADEATTNEDLDVLNRKFLNFKHLTCHQGVVVEKAGEIMAGEIMAENYNLGRGRTMLMPATVQMPVHS